MSEIHGTGGPLPPIPDDMTIVQFMLDYAHSSRPTADKNTAWLIEDATGRRIFIDEIRSSVNALANGLNLEFNIAHDEVVCVFSPNDILWPILIWALHRLGAIVTTANPSYTVDELVHQLKTTGASLIVVHPLLYPVAHAAAQAVGIPPNNVVMLKSSADGEARAASHVTVSHLIEAGAKKPMSFTERKLQPGEARTKLAFLCFSSGTTGLPKAVSIPHYALIANIVQIATYASAETGPWETRTYRPGDISLAVLPFYHAYGLVYIMHFVLFYGMSIVIIPKFDFVGMLTSIERYRINYAPVVPPMMVLLCKHPDVRKYDLSSLRSIVSGAAPLSGEITQQLSEVLPDISISQGYGMTETCIIISMPRLDLKFGTPGSSGILIPGVTARVVRQDGTLVPRNESGELVVTGPAIALGYLNNEKATKETFVDGWVRTGDEVIINDAGELFVVDRIKELLKVKGFQVAPAELEGFLLDHPDVSDVCVVSVLDDYNGDLPLAFIVPSPSAQKRIAQNPAEADMIKNALIKHVAEGKSSYKQLTAGVEFVDAIPRNPSGKLLRRLSRDRARDMWKNEKLSTSSKARL